MTMELSEMFLATKVEATPSASTRVSVAVEHAHSATELEFEALEASASARDSYETTRSRDSFAMLDGETIESVVIVE
ncbi:hypothetical protein PINS_up001782 [Pythium insidiosum]|nr:hypothetical protein PINS_up001782 [Pythium insidiosum]